VNGFPKIFVLMIGSAHVRKPGRGPQRRVLASGAPGIRVRGGRRAETHRFERVWGPEAAQPAIGMEIFRRFTATFDVARGKLYLKPNRHLREPIPEPPQ